MQALSLDDISKFPGFTNKSLQNFGQNLFIIPDNLLIKASMEVEFPPM